MDLGALDIKEIAQIRKRYFVLTEDKSTVAIKNVLLSNGFDQDDYTLQSYFGVTDPHRLQVIVDIIKGIQPEATIIVHRDRDYLNVEEVAEWEKIVRSFGAEPFITELKDIEDYLIRPDYLAEKNANLTLLEASDFINRAVEQLRADAIADYTNGRLEILRKQGVRNINHGRLAAEAAEAANQNARALIKGKKLRAAIRRIFQADRATNLRSEGTSPHLSDVKLMALSARNARGR
jgi:hypothetical protein